MRGNELLNKMELVDPAYVEAADVTPKSKKPGWMKYGAVAACLCITLLALFFQMPNPDNTFFVKAYALEIADDGTIGLSETDLLNQPDVWGGHFDGENFYVSIGLRYEGNNIESVDFTTEEGFFAKQYVGDLTVDNNVSKLYVGADNQLVMYGTEFEIVGDMITLNHETMTDDLLLFWGKQIADRREVPENIEIKATAAFYDGQTQEITILIDLSETGVFSFTPDEKELERHKKEGDYYRSLSLDKCELVEESVETVTDVYEVKLEGNTSWITIRDEMEFDRDGVWRDGIRGSFGADGYEVYIPVIKRDANGVYTGMLYRVPKNLHYSSD